MKQNEDDAYVIKYNVLLRTRFDPFLSIDVLFMYIVTCYLLYSTPNTTHHNHGPWRTLTARLSANDTSQETSLKTLASNSTSTPPSRQPYDTPVTWLIRETVNHSFCL